MTATDPLPRSRAQALLVGVLGVSALAVGLVVALLNANPRVEETPQSVPVVEPDFRSRSSYSTLEGLVAASDVVFSGEIVAVTLGRVAGDPADGNAGRVQFHDVSVSIDRLVSSSAVGVAEDGQLTIEMLFLPGEPGAYASPKSPWWHVGATAMFFAHLDRTAPGREAVLVSPEGIYFLPDTGVGTLEAAGSEPIDGLNGRTVDEVVAAIRLLETGE